MLPQKKTWLARGHVLVPARQALPAGDYQIDHEIKVTYGQIQSIRDTYGQIYDRVRDDIKIVVKTAFVDQVSRPEVQIAKKPLKIGFQGSPGKISK